MEQLIQLNPAANSMTIPVKPNLDSNYAATKMIADKIFEALYLLTPARIPYWLRECLTQQLPGLFGSLLVDTEQDTVAPIESVGQLVQMITVKVQGVESAWNVSNQDIDGIIYDLMRDYVE